MADKNVDDLVRAHQQKRRELQQSGQRLKSSAQATVVCFVDLAGSTELKTRLEPEEWLGYVYEFLSTVDQHARTSGGTVVKRIGDELMLTFPAVAKSEEFLDRIAADPELPSNSYKVALDFREAYHFKFGDYLENDPYGTMVDRCARIGKLAGAGAVLCSAPYRQDADSARYASAGQFKLKGLPEPEEVFFRRPAGVDDGYLKPLLDVLNQSGSQAEGYHSLPRTVTPSYLASLGTTDAEVMSRAVEKPFRPG